MSENYGYKVNSCNEFPSLLMKDSCQGKFE